MKLTLSWPDRLALLNHYQPTDDQACQAFSVTPVELQTARTLLRSGAFRPSTQIDLAQYADLFNTPGKISTESGIIDEVESILREPVIEKHHPATSYVKPVAPPVSVTPSMKPETATKRIKPPQKRGRKGSSITTALLAVTETPVPAIEFAETHGVSLAVLRQSKRFITAMDSITANRIGKINVRQDKETKVLMIWRDVENGHNQLDGD